MESREKRKGEDRDIWVNVCGGEKSREKKKKKKRNVWMIERKKGKIIYKKKKGQFRNSTIIFSQ